MTSCYCDKAITRVHLMKVASEPQIKPSNLGRKSIICTQHCHSVLLSLKANTHFTVQQMVWLSRPVCVQCMAEAE